MRHTNRSTARMRMLAPKEDTGTCTLYARRDNATFVPINTTTHIPCWRCQWDALNNLSSFEALRYNNGPAHTYFTLPYLQWYGGALSFHDGHTHMLNNTAPTRTGRPPAPASAS